MTQMSVRGINGAFTDCPTCNGSGLEPRFGTFEQCSKCFPQKPNLTTDQTEAINKLGEAFERTSSGNGK